MDSPLVVAESLLCIPHTYVRGMTLVIPPILDSIFVAWFNGSVGGVTQPCSRSLVLSTLIIGRLKVSTQTDVEICSLNS